MNLSKYPKRRLSYLQVKDEEKLKKARKKAKLELKCSHCGNDKFMITTMGLEICTKCYWCINLIL